MRKAASHTLPESRGSQAKLLLVSLLIALVGIFQAIVRKTLRR
jgi:hypothetical protein